MCEQKTAKTLRELFCHVSVLLLGDPCRLWNRSVSCLHFGFPIDSVFSFCSASSQLPLWVSLSRERMETFAHMLGAF